MQSENPQSLPQNPLAPPGFSPIVFDTFSGLNTQASRPGIGDTEMYICDGFMPLGKNNLRTLPGTGPSIYVSPPNTQIVFYDFGNIGDVPICVIFLTDGSIVQLNTSSLVSVPIAPAGTISSPSQTSVGITQWGNQFIVIVAQQTNGYLIWDGQVLFQPGTLAPLVDIVNSGSNYSSQPTFILETTGSGVGTTFNAILDNDLIQEIDLVNPGSGFGLNDFINLVIQGGGSDNTARATATIGPGGGIQNVDVLQSGNDYVLGNEVKFTGGGSGSGASAYANIQSLNSSGTGGVVQSVTVIKSGTGYTSSPTATIVSGTGSGAVLAVNIFQGQITAINVTDGGSGYDTPPTVSLIGDGTGGSFLAEINDTGVVTKVNVVDGGQGYTKVLVHFSGGNNAAEANANLMPFGISGSNAETFLSRIWVADGAKFSFTAPESISDFAASDGGGTIKSTDSFLRNQITSLKQTNGFLYLIGDSSENYISGVQTTGTPPTTTFNNQNADPEIGTSWPTTVDVFSRNIVFANSFGAHISYGGAVSKISDNLDGIYNSVPNFGGIVPSAAKAIIYGKRVWMILLPVIDQVSGQQVNKLFLWNGKVWFSSQQNIDLSFIQHQELNSVITAYGTDGKRIHALFQRPSANFTKTVQSKLWDQPGGYMFTKATTRLWGLVYFFSLNEMELDVSIDNENGSSSATVTPILESVTIINVLGATVTVVNSLGASVSVTNSGVGVVVFPPDAVGQQGQLTGLTLSTNAADMTLISMSIQNEIVAYRG